MSTRTRRIVTILAAVGLAAAGLVLDGPTATAQQAVTLDDDDVGGVVRSAGGPEAGVWVIAETDDFATLYRKIVVTDDEGRYVLPDLPEADYDVWVRGYGLVDSPRVATRPGQALDLSAVEAPTPRDAAQVYPANYWYSLMEVPEKAEFPGTGGDGNGIPASVRTQAHWIDLLKQGCQLCHQLGNLPTREIPNAADFDSTEAAWAHRIVTGQRASNMARTISRFGRQRGIAAYADWTDRITTGEVPQQPPRPQGRERDVVLTLWEWGGETGYIHDEIATDKRDPSVNAGGPVYGVEFANDKLVWVDPNTNEAHEVVLPVRDTPGEGDFQSYIAQEMPNPSFYFGDELIWNNPGNPHNPMMDGQGRVWMTHQIRGPGNPAWCREGSDNPYAQYYPLERAARHVAYYDPATEETELIDTCFNTHHLQFGFDADDTLYLSSVSDVIGWVNTKVYDETGDAQASQGWCPTVVDTTGDGRIGEFTSLREDPDPAKDRQMGRGWYGIVPDPTEPNVVWAASGGVPGQIVRLDIGDNPPESCIAEYYQPPFENERAAVQGYSPRGVDIDRNGVVWTALSGSGHIAKFDRSQCAVLNGPDATGQHCPEGWTLYATPGPQMKGVTDHGSADFHYYHWVDQFNTLGLGDNVPIATGSTSDSLLAFLPEEEEYVIMRVPYPLGFYSRGMDGRIDDPGTGWKGRAVWADYGTNAVWHNEGGKGTQGNLVKFQVRPHPLAK
ncbi:MAG: carboxypeptidase-like regulatory domain-containing protein [Acidobacteria bacterium]|nr:carboxypeptidase-like regulatory domain-containing protein [Acidobacteriota bacterium]